jgi:nucleoside-diphosphate-sugar epimerase
MGWTVDATGSAGNVDFSDTATVRLVAAQATHVLSSVPPLVDGDPVLMAYGDALAGKWLGYLSSTGVYGDAGGAWVDESAPLRGRRDSRNVADQDWLALGSRVFRLPGIYGPGRSALDRVAEGKAHRVDLPGQVFSRVHVDDIVSGVIAGFDAPPGAYNLADNAPCDQNAVIEMAANLVGVDAPPFVSLDSLSPMARGFYAENRRVANGKAKRVLGWTPAYPDFGSGLRALRAMSNPASATTPPAAASHDQR